MGEISMGFVVLMGIVTVFIVLVCLIAITKIMSAIVTRFLEKKPAPAPVASAAAPAAAAAPAVSTLSTVNKPQLLAAVSACIAESMGTDVSHIKIHSIRPLAAAATNNGQVMAAISSAIAEDMKTDVSHIRIHSIKKV